MVHSRAPREACVPRSDFPSRGTDPGSSFDLSVARAGVRARLRVLAHRRGVFGGLRRDATFLRGPKTSAQRLAQVDRGRPSPRDAARARARAATHGRDRSRWTAAKRVRQALPPHRQNHARPVHARSRYLAPQRPSPVGTALDRRSEPAVFAARPPVAPLPFSWDWARSGVRRLSPWAKQRANDRGHRWVANSERREWELPGDTEAALGTGALIEQVATGLGGTGPAAVRVTVKVARAPTRVLAWSSTLHPTDRRGWGAPDRSSGDHRLATGDPEPTRRNRIRATQRQPPRPRANRISAGS